MAQSPDAGTQTRILAIYSDASTLTANVGVAQGLSEVLDGRLAPRYELLTEFRGFQQFPEDAETVSFVDMLERKYADRPLDAVLAIGPQALRIVLEHRARFAPETPVIAAAVTERSYPEPLQNDIHLVRSFFDLAGTLALARRMQPDARRIVVFTGSSEFDAAWQRSVRDELAGETELDVEFTSGLTLSEFTRVAEGLDPDTILLILTIFEDAAGARFIPAEAAEAIARVSAAPAWSVYRTFIKDSDNGVGVVGGVVEPFELIGRTLGELALEVMAGEAEPATIVSMPRTAMINWDEMIRYDLDPNRLPEDVILLNYDQTFWERYRVIVLSSLAILLAQTATIAALVMQGRRWRIAQDALVAQKLELARLYRVSQLGALSGAITHELNQPLTAILADSEAAAMFLRRSPPDIEAVAEILGDIAEQDRRAAKIIADLRSLMSRRAVEPAPVDLNEVVTSVARLTNSEAVMRNVRINVSTATRPLVVLGDTEQFRQIVLNLILNSMEAMKDQLPETRTLTIETTEMADGRCAIVVQDNGPGLATDLEDDPFRPFVTTKAGGLGMGLAICKTIAEAYDGTLEFVPAPRGARVVLALPAA